MLVYDTETLRTVSLTGYGRDYVAAVLALTARLGEHRNRPAVAVRLFGARSLAELLERHASLFARLRLPGDG